jgi:hypothetical protein
MFEMSVIIQDKTEDQQLPKARRKLKGISLIKGNRRVAIVSHEKSLNIWD